ncbi:MAG: MFS transporter [Candidatus Thorarchaeota archaeon]
MSDSEPMISPADEESQNRGIHIVLFGGLTFLTIAAAGMLHINQPEFILDRFVGISEIEYTLFDTVLYLSYLIFGIITGVLSDRWSQRKVFVLVGTSGSILFYWLMTTTLSYPLLLTYRFLQGAFTVMTWQTFMTLALDFSGVTDRGKNMGIFGAFLGLGMGLGPAFGGITASIGVFVPYYAAIVLNALALIVSLVSLRDPSVTQQRPTLSHSFAIAKRHPKLIIPGLFNFTDRLLIGFLLTALPLFLLTILGLSESLRGLSLAIFALPFIILQYPMGKLSDRLGRYLPIIIGSVGYGIVLMGLGYIGAIGFEALLLMLVILGIFAGVTTPPNMALVGDIVDEKDKAMGMGLFNVMGNLGITIGPVIFGFLWLVSDMYSAFLFAGLFQLLVLILNLILIKGVFREKIL